MHAFSDAAKPRAVMPPSTSSIFAPSYSRSLGPVAVAGGIFQREFQFEPLPSPRSACPRLVAPVAAKTQFAALPSDAWPAELPGWPFHLDGPVAVLRGAETASAAVAAFREVLASLGIDFEFSAVKWKARCVGLGVEFVARLYSRSGSPTTAQEPELLVELQRQRGSVSRARAPLVPPGLHLHLFHLQASAFFGVARKVVAGLRAAAIAAPLKGQRPVTVSAEGLDEDADAGRDSAQAGGESPAGRAEPSTPPLLLPPPACLALRAPPAAVHTALGAGADAAAFDEALAELLRAVSVPFAGGAGEAAAAAALTLMAAPEAREPLAAAAAAALSGGKGGALPALAGALLASATDALPSSPARRAASAAALRAMAEGSGAAAALLLRLGAAPALLDALAALPCVRTAAARREALGAVAAMVSHSRAHAAAAVAQGCGPRLAALAGPPYAGVDAACDALVRRAGTILA